MLCQLSPSNFLLLRRPVLLADLKCFSEERKAAFGIPVPRVRNAQLNRRKPTGGTFLEGGTQILPLDLIRGPAFLASKDAPFCKHLWARGAPV